ncbi:MAG: pantoate--beta-alanine ligase [Pedosphaera sp.]|nr:pantoate--beta-alanine ligase [Pedosphaera sp.]
MRVIKVVKKMQTMARRWQSEKKRVSFVPTMGYLHSGHESLITAARRRVGRSGVVVVSIFVNPTQFAATEDLSRYPQNLVGDLAMCRRAGVDVIFAPSDEEMYPSETVGFSTYVSESFLSQSMEGISRPTHFRGVATVVTKLFNIVLPSVAFFGAKDFQQAAVLRKMVRDLNMPLTVVVAPTVREPDGLAMSSRNAYLTPTQRTQAVVLSQAITQARQRVQASLKPLPAKTLFKEIEHIIRQQPEAELEYIEFFHPDTLVPVTNILRGHHIALAVRFGATRLIDNGPV